MTATFYHGKTTMVDHIATADIEAGDVLVFGDETRIAHRPIRNGQLGALAAPTGNGVYKVEKATGSGTAFSVGAKVYYDSTNGRAVGTATGNKGMGYVVSPATNDDPIVIVRHDVL